MKKVINDFKEFALRGNMFDMAVGMIIGSAFTGLVKSVVDCLINPIISVFTGGTVDFSSYVWTINGVDILYGSFISNLINFLITAVVIFMMVKMINQLRNLNKKEEVVEEEKKPEISTTDQLLTQILEEMKNK